MQQFALKKLSLRHSNLIITDHNVVSEDILFLNCVKRLWPWNQRAADSEGHSQKYCEYVTHIRLSFCSINSIRGRWDKYTGCGILN
jgi:hypothetical protein